MLRWRTIGANKMKCVQDTPNYELGLNQNPIYPKKATLVATIFALCNSHKLTQFHSL